uniref:Uncharacterized protein n=1 Tax=Arundo donax TaxID=35708 RepID=A0A0A9C1P9_ARUDO
MMMWTAGNSAFTTSEMTNGCLIFQWGRPTHLA